jgi:hypothetical protein
MFLATLIHNMPALTQHTHIKKKRYSILGGLNTVVLYKLWCSLYCFCGHDCSILFNYCSVFTYVTSIYCSVFTYVTSIYCSVFAYVTSIYCSVFAYVTSINCNVFAYVTSIYCSVFAYVTSIYCSVFAYVTSIYCSVFAYVTSIYCSVFAYVTSIYCSVFADMTVVYCSNTSAKMAQLPDYASYCLLRGTPQPEHKTHWFVTGHLLSWFNSSEQCNRPDNTSEKMYNLYYNCNI